MMETEKRNSNEEERVAKLARDKVFDAYVKPRLKSHLECLQDAAKQELLDSWPSYADEKARKQWESFDGGEWQHNLWRDQREPGYHADTAISDEYLGGMSEGDMDDVGFNASRPDAGSEHARALRET